MSEDRTQYGESRKMKDPSRVFRKVEAPKGSILEKKVEKYIADEIKKMGGLAFKFLSSSMTGVPDRIILIRGRVKFLEVKAEKGTLSKRQKAVAVQFEKLGFKIDVVQGIEEAEQYIQDLEDELDVYR